MLKNSEPNTKPWRPSEVILFHVFKVLNLQLIGTRYSLFVNTFSWNKVHLLENHKPLTWQLTNHGSMCQKPLKGPWILPLVSSLHFQFSMIPVKQC